MESYHPVEAKTNVQKLFWSKKEVGAIVFGLKRRYKCCAELTKILVQERFEETSGNILLTLRSVTQKPLQYFLDNKDFTKVEKL